MCALASGEGPLFLDEAKAVSTVARDSVRNEAVAQRPASGAFDGQTVAKSNAGLTRAEVRAQAIANPPASGVFDGSTVAQQHRVAPTQATGE